MRRPTPHKLLAFLLLALGAGLPLHGISKPHRSGGDVRQQVFALEEQWRQAQLADDVAAMEKLLSENYIGITITGRVVTKAQQLERMRRREVSVSRFETSDTHIKFIAHNQVAIVNSLARVEGTSDGRPIKGSFRYTRVYQRVPGGSWKITNFEATHVPADDAGLPASATPAPTPTTPPLR